MLENAILDADFCIRLGRFNGIKLLELLIPSVVKKAYIHQYVYNDEILIPASAKIQINQLIKGGNIEVIDDKNFSATDKSLFEATKVLLKRVMIGTQEKGKNWGEVLSLASAKVLGITILMSDESMLQNIIDRHLNIGSPNDIKVFRVINVIEWIRDNPTCGINRKIAKAIWAASDKSRAVVEVSKKIFNDIWPVIN
ncbi:MAG TPA: hypothetical protein VHY08_19540 [Bacillota bacterium]|nr:hypothetical protein [Bacillota bacterium]